MTAYSIPVSGRASVSVIVYDLFNYVVSSLENKPIYCPINGSLWAG
jgi:hypothetical protein